MWFCVCVFSKSENSVCYSFPTFSQWSNGGYNYMYAFSFSFIFIIFLFQIFKLSPVQSVCITEGSDTTKEVRNTILSLYIYIYILYFILLNIEWEMRMCCTMNPGVKISILTLFFAIFNQCISAVHVTF